MEMNQTEANWMEPMDICVMCDMYECEQTAWNIK
jgi:hypothetical protein